MQYTQILKLTNYEWPLPTHVLECDRYPTKIVELSRCVQPMALAPLTGVPMPSSTLFSYHLTPSMPSSSTGLAAIASHPHPSRYSPLCRDLQSSQTRICKFKIKKIHAKLWCIVSNLKENLGNSYYYVRKNRVPIRKNLKKQEGGRKEERKKEKRKERKWERKKDRKGERKKENKKRRNKGREKERRKERKVIIQDINTESNRIFVKNPLENHIFIENQQ